MAWLAQVSILAVSVAVLQGDSVLGTRVFGDGPSAKLRAPDYVAELLLEGEFPESVWAARSLRDYSAEDLGLLASALRRAGAKSEAARLTASADSCAAVLRVKFELFDSGRLVDPLIGVESPTTHAGSARTLDDTQAAILDRMIRSLPGSRPEPTVLECRVGGTPEEARAKAIKGGGSAHEIGEAFSVQVTRESAHHAPVVRVRWVRAIPCGPSSELGEGAQASRSLTLLALDARIVMPLNRSEATVVAEAGVVVGSPDDARRWRLALQVSMGP